MASYTQKAAMARLGARKRFMNATDREERLRLRKERVAARDATEIATWPVEPLETETFDEGANASASASLLATLQQHHRPEDVRNVF